MKVWRVGRYYTNVDLAYANGIRAIAALDGDDPGEPVEMDMSGDEWNKLNPTGIALKGPADV